MTTGGFSSKRLARVRPPDEWMRRLGTLPLVHQPGERRMYDTAAEVTGAHRPGHAEGVDRCLQVTRAGVHDRRDALVAGSLELVQP